MEASCTTLSTHQLEVRLGIVELHLSTSPDRYRHAHAKASVAFTSRLHCFLPKVMERCEPASPLPFLGLTTCGFLTTTTTMDVDGHTFDRYQKDASKLLEWVNCHVVADKASLFSYFLLCTGTVKSNLHHHCPIVLHTSSSVLTNPGTNSGDV